MVVHMLWIINKTGGLIFDKTFAPGLPELSTNGLLKLASGFHTQTAIAQQLAPRHGCSGILSLDAAGFRLFCLETFTLIKFVLITDASADEGRMENLLERLYALYADFVLKNPFYELEQPIRNCENWERELKTAITECSQ
eukprot:TRINITY_DN13387_c0_g1_i1.p1 TRINITY_DN13387_c0_g1~~TRINITY_DN13387_c0_g1_i1.p1  ORF type:complete len:140 (+),score=42.61 TRINITY_DN13387_c0_g1_i1:56-475(+)